MGNDGGSIPKRDDLVKTRHRQEQQDPQQKETTRWTCCALSKRPLEEPVVSDPLGKMYNKSAALEFLLDRDRFGEDGRQVAGHLVSLKDLVDLKLTRNAQATRWICPISLKEMGAGAGKMELRWIYLVGCGCVLTEGGLRQIAGAECPVCGKDRPDVAVVSVNPAPEDEEIMRIRLMEKRKREKEEKEKRKLERKEQKKRKKGAAVDDQADLDVQDGIEGDAGQQKSKKAKPSLPQSRLVQTPSSNIHSTSMAKLTNEIQLETQQSLVKLSSSTMSSVYGPRDVNGKQLLGQQKESWMTKGTWTRYAA